MTTSLKEQKAALERQRNALQRQIAAAEAAMLNTSTANSENMTFVSVAQLAASIPGVTVGGVRWDLWNADSNGLAESGAIIRRGGRILIIRERYLTWLAGRKDVRSERIAAAISALRIIVGVDYTQAPEQELQDLIGAASEVVNRAQAERYGRREGRS